MAIEPPSNNQDENLKKIGETVEGMKADIDALKEAQDEINKIQDELNELILIRNGQKR